MGIKIIQKTTLQVYTQLETPSKLIEDIIDDCVVTAVKHSHFSLASRLGEDII